METAKTKTGPTLAEFVVIISLMMSLTALSIDSMLPALSQIGTDLGVHNDNTRQLVVTTIFLGLAVGQLFFGPLSDRVGRKRAVYAGYALYIFGSLVALLAFSFPMLLVGRLLQGAGVASPRAVTLAIVRDRYEGRAMARVMSFVMTVFILVPMIAPSMGQAVLFFSGWRAIFGTLALLALVSLTWFAVRMPETLHPDDCRPFTLERIVDAIRQILKNRIATGYTISAGLISGAFLGYLSSSQQIFQEQYALGDLFPIYFSIIAVALGLASFINSRLVMRYGMRFLVWWALIAITGLAVVALGIGLLTNGLPPLPVFMAYLMTSFFGVGILFGNQNSLAMEPLGHLAGIGAAIVGSLSTFISMPLGIAIGQAYNGTVIPLILGLGTLAGLSLFVVRWAEKGRPA